jgi:hypothetical protein
MISRNPITSLKAHFDGKGIVLDEPLPRDLPPNTPVEVRFKTPLSENGQTPVEANSREETVLDKIAKLAKPGGLPPDFAAQHDHYVKGLPKR